MQYNNGSYYNYRFTTNANDDCVEELKHNTEININVLANDSDPDHDRIYVSAIVIPPKYGTAKIISDEQQQSTIKLYS